MLSESYGVIDRRDGNEKLQVVAAAVDTEAGHFFVATQSAMLLCFSLSSSQVFFPLVILSPNVVSSFSFLRLMERIS